VELSVTTSRAADILVVAFSGELDLSTAPVLREELLQALCVPASDIVVDLREVVFMDSTGLGLLIGAHRRAQAAGASVRVVCTQPDLLRVLRVSGLDQVLTVDTSIGDAVAAMGQRVC
jgi:anti-sigma B factor antagonist